MRRIAFLLLLPLIAGVCAGAETKKWPVSTPEPKAIIKRDEWVKVETHGTARRSGAALVYLPTEKAFLYGMGRLGAWNDRGPYPYDELTFTLADRVWENRFPPGKEEWGPKVGICKPPPHRSHGYRITDTKGNARLGLWEARFHGYYQYALDTDRNVLFAYTMNHLLEYNPATRVWRDLKPQGNPNPTRFELWWGSLCYDPVNKELVLFGGNNGAREFNDPGTWIYSVAKNAWRRMPNTDSAALNKARGLVKTFRPLVVRLHVACCNRYFKTGLAEDGEAKLEDSAKALRQLLAGIGKDLVQQGEGREKAQFVRAAVELAAAVQSLSGIEVAASPDGIKAALAASRAVRRAEFHLLDEPGPRAHSPMVYDPTSKSIVLFGGDRLDMLYADTWVYDCATRTWSERCPPVGPSPRAGHALLFLPKSKKVALVGGYRFDAQTGYWGALYKQLPVQAWTYDVAGNTWRLIKDFGPPAGGKPKPNSPPRTIGSKGAATMAAVNEDDVVVALSDESRTRVTRACRLDPTRPDKARTAKLGVEPGTVEWRTGPYDPDWYLDGRSPDEEAFAKAIEMIPVNTWTVLTPKKTTRLPRQNRDWGTAVIDTDRDCIYRWSGGHSAHCGTDIPVFSLRTGLYHIKYPPAFPLNGIGSSGSQPSRSDFLGNPWISAHSYHSYAYCPASKKMLCTGHQRFSFAYDPDTGTWAYGPQPKGMQVGSFYTLTLCSTPKGAMAWEQGLFRYASIRREWKELKVVGQKLPRPKCDGSGMCYDSKRDRLILTHVAFKGDLLAVDLKTLKGDPLGMYVETVKADMLVPKGREVATGLFLRETCYDAANDLVVVAYRGKGASWPVYDCAKNAWTTIDIKGKAPMGVSTGLMYDPKRKLILAVDTNSVIRALRLDPAAAASGGSE